MKSALFVDFDNVYSGLRKLDVSIAERFAKTPQRWMNWLVESLELPQPAADGARRRVLVRRCYLNPQVYQRFRPAFNLAGFEIIDCPALTSEGKTSTDIHMVLDIVDLLVQETRYDEFIVFSADADFTPVLRKLRRWDRRTTVLAIGFPSAAYRASADLLIDQDGFVREALGFHDDEEPVTPDPPRSALQPSERDLAKAALALTRTAVAEAKAPLPLARLAATILSSVDGMDASTWAGRGSFRRLVDALDLAPLEVNWDGGGWIRDPRRHQAPASPDTEPPKVVDELTRVTKMIRAKLAEASSPLPCSQIASLITAQHATLASDWNGMGSFRKLVESLDLAPSLIDWTRSGGYLYDPRRHSLPAERASKPNGQAAAAHGWGQDRDILPIASQIHEVTGVPLLAPASYQALFRIIASDLAVSAFDLKETGKRVRDATRLHNQPISRVDVNWVLRGLLLQGHAFGTGADDAPTLARKTVENVRSLCLREQMVIDPATEDALDRWISRFG
ncbi:NYN domain-containing protein [Thiocystis violacea]|uniref:NYN domain-containing protein n=1 Tax=Thiocystis violacea TaxID=13725 RepID=UPI0019057FE9|nr:NYN domain-containing protein [Thiocystis violacea]MBK1717215.1 NYN domain-containing protein [Thiocystis violacea]